MNSHHRCRRRRSPLSGLLVVLGILLGILGEGVHLALESHRWCELHGALEHGEAGSESDVAHGPHDSHDSHPGPATDPHGDGGALVLEQDTSEEANEHELCRLQLGHQESAWRLESHRLHGTAPDPRVDGSAARHARPFEVVARLRLAPKQSPPVV